MRWGQGSGGRSQLWHVCVLRKGREKRPPALWRWEALASAALHRAAGPGRARRLAEGIGWSTRQGR